MKIATRIIVLALLTPSLGVAAGPPKVTYDEHVLPLLKEHCVSCHSQDKKKGDLVLNNYSALVQGGASGVAIKPGDGENSLLYRVTAHKAEPFMPPSKPKLPDASADVIKKWIDAGALENAGSKPVVVKPKTDVGLTSVVRGKPEGPPPMPPATLALAPVVQVAKPTAITALAASPWAPLVAVAGQKQVILYHSDTFELLGVLPFAEGTINVLRFSRTGALLLAGGGRSGKAGKVVAWKVTTGERVIEVGDETDAVLAADISPDQTQIALGGPSKVVRTYSTKDGKLLHEIKKHTDWVYTLEYSPDGVLLASGDRNGGLHVWESFTAREYFSLRGHTAAVMGVSWRNDSNVLASCSEDATVRLWEMENGSQIRSWGAHSGGCQAVSFDKGNTLVSTGRDRVSRVWNDQGQQVRAFEALPDVGLRTVFTHDAKAVVGGDWTGKVNVWSNADAKLLGTLSVTPPSLAEQFEVVARELVAKVALRDQAAATLKASKAALEQANAEIAAAQKQMADADAAAKTAAANLATAQTALQTANAPVPALQAEVNARTILFNALNEASAKVKAEADKKKDDKALAAAAQQAATLAQNAANELANARKALEAAMATVTTVTSQMTAAQQADATAKANLANAPKLIEAKTNAATTAAAKVQADQAAFDQAAAVVVATAARLDRYKVALTTARN